MTNDERERLKRRLREIETQIAAIYECGDGRQVVMDGLSNLGAEQLEIERRLKTEPFEAPRPGDAALPTPSVLASDDEPIPELAGRRVLVVDDDESVLSSATAMLAPHGCVVEGARDAAHALAVLENRTLAERYDLILVSLRLPDMSGVELFIKLQAKMNPAPVAITCGFGYDPAATLVKARRSGLRAVIYKPFRRSQLVLTFGRVLPDPAT